MRGWLLHGADAFTRASGLASDTLGLMDWNVNWRPAPPPALTPCIGICTLGDDGLCMGCLRTGDEIGAWSRMSDAERLRIMDEVLPRRSQGSHVG